VESRMTDNYKKLCCLQRDIVTHLSLLTTKWPSNSL